MKAYLAANYTIGAAAENMVEIPDRTCVCGGRVVPLLGKVQEGTTIRWDIWIEGNYEHFDKPNYPHNIELVETNGNTD